MIRIILANAMLAIFLPADAQTFYGSPCTQDCSGHNAGYRWAERKGIISEFDCAGNSDSFREGCLAYVQQRDSEGEPRDDDAPAEE
jgi:hypothetical protein